MSPFSDSDRDQTGCTALMDFLLEERYTDNSHLAKTPLLRTLAITDKTQILGRRGLTGNNSRYYGLSLLRTLNEVPRVSATTRDDCTRNDLWTSFLGKLFSWWFCMKNSAQTVINWNKGTLPLFPLLRSRTVFFFSFALLKLKTATKKTFPQEFFFNVSCTAWVRDCSFMVILPRSLGTRLFQWQVVDNFAHD